MPENDIVRDAIEFLASECKGLVADNRGFSQYDAPLGLLLARTTPWTMKQQQAAWRLAQKYHGQIEAIGIDAKTIPKPALVVYDTPIKRDIQAIDTAGRSGFWIKFSGGEDFLDLVQKVKTIPGRVFVKSEKAWHIPATVSVLEPLCTFAGENHFDFGEDVVERIGEITLQAEMAVVASKAATSDFSIDGLRRELRPFQKAGVDYIVNTSKWGRDSPRYSCIVADEMGLGKSFLALATVQYLNAYPALVICPATLKLVWEQEINLDLFDKNVVVLDSTKPFRSGDIVVVNYDILHKFADQLKSIRFKSFIGDEFHYCKSKRSRRSKLTKEITKNIPVKLALTGTPVLNRPAELISQLEILGRFKEFGGWKTFVERYCAAFQNLYGWDISGASNTAELNRKMRMMGLFLRRTKEQVLSELPPKQFAHVPFELSNRAEYDDAQENLVQWLKDNYDENALKAQQLIRIEALKQLSAKGKLESAKEWISNFLESDQKLVVFASHRDIQKQLHEAFPGSAHLFGDDDSETRQSNVDRFQNDPTCKLIVCSLKAGGIGITLTAASNVGVFEFPWTPGELYQATDRCHRIGQTESVMVWYFIGTNTIDETILQVLKDKEAIVAGVSEGKDDVLSDVVRRMLGQ